MPIYSYRCSQCEQEVEVFHHMVDHPKVRCECGKSMRRVLSGDFFTPKDKRYEFTTVHVKPGTEIRTKKQWEGFLRSNKLTDDLPVKEQLDRLTHGYAQKKSEERWKEFRRGTQELLRKAALDKNSSRSLSHQDREQISRMVNRRGR